MKTQMMMMMYFSFFARSSCVCDCREDALEILTMKDFTFYFISKVKMCEIVGDMTTKMWITGLNSSLGGGPVKGGPVKTVNSSAE